MLVVSRMASRQDWMLLANKLGFTQQDVNNIKKKLPNQEKEQVGVGSVREKREGQWCNRGRAGGRGAGAWAWAWACTGSISHPILGKIVPVGKFTNLLVVLNCWMLESHSVFWHNLSFHLSVMLCFLPPILKMLATPLGRGYVYFDVCCTL